MTPGELNIPIYKGARWSFAFTFTETGTGDPIDFSGLSPLVCEVKHPKRDQLLATAEVTSDDYSTGIVTITLTAAQTLALPLGKVRMGLKDAEDNSLLEGSPVVSWFTPT